MTGAPVINGLRFIGIVLLVLGLIKFLNHGPWVVWVILGTLAMIASAAATRRAGDGGETA